MNADLIRQLYDYNYWAHDRVWACCQSLDDDKFRQPLDYSIGSLHKQWVHVVSAEYIWFSRLNGNSPSSHLNPADYPNRDAIMEKWQQVRGMVRSYVSSLTDAKLTEPITYQNLEAVSFTQPIWTPLMQVFNHGTDHRAQILAMTHLLGGQTAEQDWILYFRETAAKKV